MNKKHQQKVKAREAKQEQQAKKVVNGIFIALVVLAVLTMLGYCVLYS
ncbi:MAG: hypothetical protein PUD40_07680 [Bacteroidales bacterium]|nr:hypothetical protein [Bacteroidales bacterium]